jgi:GAF domain
VNPNLLHETPVSVGIRRMALVILLLTIVTGIANVTYRFEHLRHLAAPYYHPYLSQFGLSDEFYVWYFLLSEILLALVFAITGGIIALHRSTTRIAMFAAIALMLFGIALPPPMHALVTHQGGINVLLCFVRAIGFALFIIFLYIFPDGRLVPRWAGILTLVLIFWSLIWPLYPPLNPYRLPHALPFLVLTFWFGTGVFAQIYRYVYVSNPVQRQQTKWVVFGLTAAILGDFVTHIAWYIFPSLQKGSDWFLQLAHQPFFILSQLLAPVAIAVSIFRYGLWEIDFIINRTLVYGLLTTLLAAVWTTTAKLLEIVFARTTGQSAAPIAAGFAVLGVGLIFGSAREKLEKFVNHHFYPNKLDLSREFVEFLPEARATISLSELLHKLVDRTLEVLHIQYGAVFLRDAKGQLQLAEIRNLSPTLAESFHWHEQLFDKMQKGSAIKQQENDFFPLLVPLMLQRGEQLDLIGVLALGSRQDGRQYSLDELWTFEVLAKRAATAIYIAQLNTANISKLTQQITVLEKRVEALEAQRLTFEPLAPLD